MKSHPEPSPPAHALAQVLDSGSVPSELAAIVEEYGCTRTLATGSGTGESAVAITAVHESRGHGLHLIIEPDQEHPLASEDRGLLARGAGSRPVRLIAKSPEVALPELLSAGTELDFALITGEKDFEQAFLEFLYLDRMLITGGILVLEHGEDGPADAVAQYIAQARAYEPRSAPDSLLLVQRKLGRQRVTTPPLPGNGRAADNGHRIAPSSVAQAVDPPGDGLSQPVLDALAPTDNRELYLARARAGHLEDVNRQLRTRLMEAELDASRRMDELLARIASAEVAHQQSEYWLAQITGSPSWRLTAPLRFVKRQARRLAR